MAGSPQPNARTVFAQRIEFGASRRLKLVGHLTHADSRRGVVLVHGLLSNKDGDGLFPPVAAALRRAGWGSLGFDFSGSGESDNNVLTLQAAFDDLGHAVALMRSIGYRQLALWGQGLGARLCLDAPIEVGSMVLTDLQPEVAGPGWLQPSPPREPMNVPRTGGARGKPALIQAAGREHLLAPALLAYVERFDIKRRAHALRCPALAMLQVAAASSGCSWPGLRALLPPGRRSAALGELQLSLVDCAEQLVLDGVRWLGQQGQVAPS